MALYRQADRRLVAQQVLVVPLQYQGAANLVRPWVHGARPNATGHVSLKDAWVEKHAA